MANERTKRIIVNLLYLWTRDAKISIHTHDSVDARYLRNQLDHLAVSDEYSDKAREAWARAVLTDLGEL